MNDEIRIECAREGSHWRVRVNGISIWEFSGWSGEKNARRLAMYLASAVAGTPSRIYVPVPTPTPEPEHE